MRLSIITITCRRDARLTLMARTLAAAARSCRAVELEWVVVDEKLWAHDPGCDLAARRAELEASGLDVLHIPPKPSNWRGPWRLTDRDMPDPNGARNTGLAFCTGDYAVFLDDHCLVTENWLLGLLPLAEASRGYRAFVIYKAPRLLSVPASGGLREEREETSARRVTPSQCNGLMGAPMEAFCDIRGFDESYAGEMKWEDLDAVMRLDRSGIPFYSPAKGSVIHVDHVRGEVCDDERPYAGTANATRWQALLASGKRRLPAWQQPTLAELRASLDPFPGSGDKGDDNGHGHSGSNGNGTHGPAGAVVPPRGVLAAGARPSLYASLSGDKLTIASAAELVKDETYRGFPWPL